MKKENSSDYYSSQNNNALLDWISGTKKFNIWWTLAWSDVVLRYRRSALGPLWLTLSMAVMIAGMGPLYASLFGTNLEKFFPHLALGIIFWSLFSSITQDSAVAFISSANYLKQGGIPIVVFVWRSLARDYIQFFHHIIIYIPVALYVGIKPGIEILLFLPAFLIFLINSHAVSLVLSIVCTRFRDFAQIVNSTMQLLMFLTPVFWMPESLPGRAAFVLWNPLAQMLDLLRTPLMGGVPNIHSWIGVLIWTVFNLVVASVLFKKFRRRIAYWI